MNGWIYRWGPAILLMTIIFIASATPGSSMPELGYWDYVVKKGGHMLGYALLAASYYHALCGEKNAPKWRFILAMFLTILFAASDEYHQKFTPGRSASPIDVGIDTAGGLIGFAVSHRAGRRKNLNSEIQKRDIA